LTFLKKTSEVEANAIYELYSTLGSQAADILVKQGIPKEVQTLLFEMDLRYRGQATSLTVRLALDEVLQPNLISIIQR